MYIKGNMGFLEEQNGGQIPSCFIVYLYEILTEFL